MLTEKTKNLRRDFTATKKEDEHIHVDFVYAMEAEEAKANIQIHAKTS